MILLVILIVIIYLSVDYIMYLRCDYINDSPSTFIKDESNYIIFSVIEVRKCTVRTQTDGEAGERRTRLNI